MSNRNKKPVNYNYKINFWGFLERVLVAALNKGSINWNDYCIDIHHINN